MSWHREGQIKKEKVQEKADWEKARFRKTGKAKVCKETKGDHDYVVPKKVTFGSGRVFKIEFNCACGKKNYNSIWPKEASQDRSYGKFCEAHQANYHGKECWACRIGYPPAK
jgi:hypothetical protein